MRRITFERVRERVTYSHFIEANGDTIALDPKRTRELRVGIVFGIDTGNEFPTEHQRLSMIYLANEATTFDPTVEIVFGEGTSPFPAIIPSDHPLASMFAI